MKGGGGEDRVECMETGQDGGSAGSHDPTPGFTVKTSVLCIHC